MTLKSLDKLRGFFDDCTKEAGIEPNKFDTVWITKSVAVQVLDEIQAEVDSRYMELPKDKDGVPIRVGDEVCGYGYPDGGVVVKALNGCMVIVGRDTIAANYAKSGLLWVASNTRHVKPRTVEDVLRDLIDGIDSVEFDALTAIGEAADEIRELMEVDR